MSVLGSDGGTVTVDDDNVYLDLDTILDTVLGTLSKTDPKLAVTALAGGKYSTRSIDIFEGISKEEFQQQYEKRDVETLKHSVLTNLPFFLQRLIKDSLLAAAAQGSSEKLCFTLNTYPYVVEDEEFIGMLIACLRFHTFSAAAIQIVSYSNKELTPKFCNDNYQIMIRYDWRSWVNEHKAFFEQSGIPNLTIITPELFVDEVPTKEEILALGAGHINPFTETTKAAARLFRLKFMPVSLFSINEKITAKNARSVLATMAVTEDDIVEHISENNPKATLTREDPLPVVNLDDAFELF